MNKNRVGIGSETMSYKQKAIERFSYLPEPYKTWALHCLYKHDEITEGELKSITKAISLFFWTDIPPGFEWLSSENKHKEQLHKENEELKKYATLLNNELFKAKLQLSQANGLNSKLVKYNARLESAIEKNFIKATLAIDIRDARIKELESQLAVNSAFINDGIVDASNCEKTDVINTLNQTLTPIKDWIHLNSCSVRLSNILLGMEYRKEHVYIENISIIDMREQRNCGKKTIAEFFGLRGY